MTAITSAQSGGTGPSIISRLWNRQLDAYPETGPRVVYLVITILATVTLYYELYVVGSVSTLVLQRLNMSFGFFVGVLAFGNLVGAFGSLLAGLADRVGRTNLVVVGLLVTGILTVWVIPAQTGKWGFLGATLAIGLVEGICLVATPALIRDFSPQTGRATAMGFWTAGPVLGSLVVSVVGSNTIPSHASSSFWTHEYYICGAVGLVVWVVALLGLRELSPQLRDQLMVSLRDRALVEARAKGLSDADLEEAQAHPFRQLIKPDVVISALGISIFLLVYYTAVGFGVIYFTTVFGFNVRDANGLGNWNWGLNLVALVVFGIVSDRLRVRKPFMVVGGVASAVMMVLFLIEAGHPHAGYYHLAALTAVLAFCLGIAYVPWMASFTETVEARNPALTATGLAIWGWTLRVIVFAAYMVLPVVVDTVTPLVTYGPQVQAYAQGSPRYNVPPEYRAFAVPPQILLSLHNNPSPSNPAFAQACKILGPTCVADLTKLAKAPASVTSFMTAHGPAVAKASSHTSSQWKNWYWVCFGGMIFFLCTVPLMRGRWSPAAARDDEEQHEAMVRTELAKLQEARGV